MTKDCLIEVVPQPLTGSEFYFCGPPTFLGHVRQILTDLKVPKDQMHYEYFGPTQQ
jgi:nitric oxide dioxygenase